VVPALPDTLVPLLTCTNLFVHTLWIAMTPRNLPLYLIHSLLTFISIHADSVMTHAKYTCSITIWNDTFILISLCLNPITVSTPYLLPKPFRIIPHLAPLETLLCHGYMHWISNPRHFGNHISHECLTMFRMPSSILMVLSFPWLLWFPTIGCILSCFAPQHPYV